MSIPKVGHMNCTYISPYLHTVKHI